MLRIIMLMMGALIVISGCGNGVESEEPVESVEPTESDRASAPETPPDDNENLDEDQSETGTDSEVSSAEKTEFDINDSETQESLMTATYQEEGLTFDQSVITEGMTQAEVEAAHGEYDFIYPGHGRAVTIYNNLGVVYSVPGPYGEDELATTDVNPDEVIVENVMYYAGVTYDEVVGALGEPDVDVYEPEEGPVSGYHFMEYVLDEGEDTELIGMFWMHEDENGQLIVDVMTKDERPADVDGTAVQTENQTAGQVDAEVEEMLTAFIESYLSALEDYYNDESEEVFDYTEPSSDNGAIISNNKESGNFSNHENHDIKILNMEERDSIYYVTVARKYSHATSDGVREGTVQYEIFNTAKGFKVMNFEEINDEPAS